MTKRRPRVALFVTCLADHFFPQVGEAVVRVLRHLGVEVDFPEGQTCCGQPAFNTGYWAEALVAGRRFLEVFRDAEYIVSPSGSCVSMVRVFYPELFRDDPPRLRQAQDLARRVHEFSEFLVRVLGVEDIGARLHARITYHDACHALRELGIREEPRRLLRAIRGAELVEFPHHEVCCGFGGTFSVKYAPISTAILQEKVRNLLASGADILTSTDVSCLMHIGGALSREGAPIRTLHLAEVLALGLEEARRSPTPASEVPR